MCISDCFHLLLPLLLQACLNRLKCMIFTPLKIHMTLLRHLFMSFFRSQLKHYSWGFFQGHTSCCPVSHKIIGKQNCRPRLEADGFSAVPFLLCMCEVMELSTSFDWGLQKRTAPARRLTSILLCIWCCTASLPWTDRIRYTRPKVKWFLSRKSVIKQSSVMMMIWGDRKM